MIWAAAGVEYAGCSYMLSSEPTLRICVANLSFCEIAGLFAGINIKTLNSSGDK